MGGFAWVTLATNDSYSLGALVLAHSLRQVGTSYQLAVLVTPGVTTPMREKLGVAFNVVQEVNILDSKDEANLRLLQRPELGVTFTKLHCWRLTQFEKCVFLDADTLVLENADELFERDEFSAAPDVGWPDCFNSGVFVYTPSNDTYEKLVTFALETGSFDGGDQGLLNLYFSDWAYKDISKHLPFIYNMCSTASYSYLPAFKQFGRNVKIVHFIGATKPWLQYFDTESRQVQASPGLQHLQQVLQHWWNIFFSLIQPNLTSEMARGKSPAVHNPPSAPIYHRPSRSYFHETEPRNDNFVTSHDFNDVWDPWEEYELKHSHSTVQTEPLPVFTQLEAPVNEPFEPHNTNAHSENQIHYFGNEPPPPIHNEPVHSEPIHNEPVRNEPIHNEPINVHTQHSPEPPPRVFSESQSQSVVSKSQKKDIFDFPKETPIVRDIPPVQSPPALPYEIEPTCTIASESALHPDDNDEDAGLAGAFSQLKLGEPRSPGQFAFEDHLRRQGWEVGNIDYLGRDSFDNIWKKICQTIEATLVQVSPVPETVPVPQKETTPPSASAVTETEPSPALTSETAPTPQTQTETVSTPESAPQPPTQTVAESVVTPETPQSLEPIAQTPVLESPKSTEAAAREITAPALALPVSAPPAAETSAPVPAAETPAPVSEIPALLPTAETPAAVPETPKTPTSPEPVAETPAPVPETPAPVPKAETPAPAAVPETPKTPTTPEPVTETPTPVPATPAPVPETPAPVPTAETPAPAAVPETPQTPTTPELVAETPAPVPETPAPVSEIPAPVPETSAPVTATETPASVPETPTQVPVTETPVPGTPAPSVADTAAQVTAAETPANVPVSKTTPAPVTVAEPVAAAIPKTECQRLQKTAAKAEVEAPTTPPPVGKAESVLSEGEQAQAGPTPPPRKTGGGPKKGGKSKK